MSPTKAPQESTEFAWHVHGALDSWTSKVDTKASIVLAIETAIFGFVLTLTQEGRTFASLSGRAEIGYDVGLGLLLLGTILALAVVMPQLNRRKSKREWRSNMIYFGHLRHWDPQALAKALGTGSPDVDQLANQLVAMSKIAWRKHVVLQWSLSALVFGISCLLLVAVTA